MDRLGPAIRPHRRDSVVEAYETGRPARVGAVQRRSEGRLHAGNAALDLQAGGGERVAEIAGAFVLLVPQLGMVVDEPADLRNDAGLRCDGVEDRQRIGHRERLPERPLDEHLHELRLVVGGAGGVVDRRRILGGPLTCRRQHVAVEAVDGRAGESFLGRARPGWSRAHRPDRYASLGQDAVDDTRQTGDRGRRPLVEGELRVGDRRAFGKRGDPYSRQQLTLLEACLVRPDDEVGDR